MEDLKPWNAPDFTVASDSARRARYRALQSWYRTEVLRVPPGTATVKSKNGKERVITPGNMLPEDEAKPGRKGLNFLGRDVADYVEQRAAEALAEGMTLEPTRLYRNMLSSMPLCFNLFGWLRGHPAKAAAALGDVLSLDIARIRDVKVEWAPRPALLGDRTAFDAYVEYETRSGEPGFLGVETKYTEPFSREEYPRAAYEPLTQEPASGFKQGAAGELEKRTTNQLWRNTLLAFALRRKLGWRLGHAVVLSCEGDAGAAAAIEGISKCHQRPDEILRAGTLEDLVHALKRHPAMAERAIAFERRYLDLSPVRAAWEPRPPTVST
jgi:hypothetical protein